MSRILIVEDDASLVLGLNSALQGEGFDTVVARTGPEGMRLALEEDPDVILLDLMLPGMSGLEICKRARDAGVRAKVIMLTSRSEEDDRVIGLELGADDYVTKPFSVRELIARIRAHLRHEAGGESTLPDRVRFDDVLVDFKRREVSRGGQVQPVTNREFRLLEYLLRHPGEVLTRERLLEDAWGYEAYLTTRTVDNHILRLRKHIEPDPENPRYIKTVRGAGYRLDVPLHRVLR
jgi:two-component system, OmpR family, response regulator VicR